MLSPSAGFAISRGRGNIQGHLYKFENGKWLEIFSFPYSDFPILHIFDENKIWFVNHLSHHGAYRPVFNELNKNKFTSLELPKLMWDAIDFAMMKSIHVNRGGTAWMAGQQGYLLFYDGTKWKEFPSPIKKDTLASLLSGDINSISMIDDSSGWAVGKDGVILKFTNGHWNYFLSPVKKNLNAIQMLNNDYGWIVGDRGIILKYENNGWRKIDLDHSYNLLSLKILSDSTTYFCGDNSTLIKYEAGSWFKDLTIANFPEIFYDLDVITDKNNFKNIWLIGKDGIYTNSQTLGFSFTKITGQSGLQEDIRTGMFFKKDETSDLKFFALNENAPSVFHEKTSAGSFQQKPLLKEVLNPMSETIAFAFGDVNNDGAIDLFQIQNKNNLSFLLGDDEYFYDWTLRSNLNFDELDFPLYTSARFVDLNNDGNLDLYFFSQENNDIIYSNNGAAQFTKLNVNPTRKKIENNPNGVIFSDFNEDNLVDLLITYSAPINKAVCELYLNKGNFTFEQKIDSSFFVGNENSLLTTSAVAADFNNDAHNDILIYNQRDQSWLLINDGNCNFKKYYLSNDPITHADDSKGIINAADINNDGLLDIFISSKIYLNKGNLQFEEISENVGVSFLGNPIFEDVDDDGDADLFIGSSKYSLGKGERSALFRNNSIKRNAIKFFIEGSESNKSAIGTKIILAHLRDKDTLYQLREIGLGCSPVGLQNFTPITFGIPDGELLFAKIIFPSGKIIEVTDLKINSTNTIRETNFIQTKTTDLQKSVARTFLLIDSKNEILRLFIIVGMLLLLSIVLKKFILTKIIFKPVTILAVILFYLLHIHFTAHLSLVDSLLRGSLFYISGVILLFTLASSITKKREEKYFSHFKIISLLGEGGMGKVFKAFDTINKKFVALKILHPHLLDDVENKKRFNSEGQILASMNHKNIVQVFEIGQIENQGFIALELCTGKTLKQFVKDEFPIDEDRIIDIVYQLCDGLREIHSKNIIHRDLKSNNIMIDVAGQIKIMDFGLSKSPIVTSMSSLGSVIGTLGYVSPEQITNSAVDNRSDIFSLGVILYELATGKIPFNGENEIALIHSIFNDVPVAPSTLNKTISPKFDSLVFKMLSKSKEDRFDSAEDALNEIRKTL